MSLVASVIVELDGFRLEADLRVEDGRTTALVGPNGAGKTTALRVLAGLLALTDGSVDLGGRVLDCPSRDTFVPAEDRAVGVVFQDYRLFPHVSVAANVAFGLRAQHISRAEAARRTAEWLDRVGLADRADARPSELSGGQAQRVALARALVTEPDLLLLDEPLAALDAATRNDLRRDLGRHLSSFAGPRIIVTHDPVDAAVLADGVVVFDAGRVVQVGTPAHIVARPRSRWVADLAATNLLVGRLDGTTLLLDGGGTLVLAEPPVAAGRAQRAFAAIAPRAVTLSAERPGGSARNAWAGVVETMEPVGGRMRVRVAGPPSVVAEITLAAAADLALAPGSAVWSAVKATEIDAYPA